MNSGLKYCVNLMKRSLFLSLSLSGTFPLFCSSFSLCDISNNKTSVEPPENWTLGKFYEVIKNCRCFHMWYFEVLSNYFQMCNHNWLLQRKQTLITLNDFIFNFPIGCVFSRIFLVELWLSDLCCRFDCSCLRHSVARLDSSAGVLSI